MIAFDAATNTTSTNTNTNSFSHTCTGSDRFLIVPCASLNNGTSDAITSVTYDGVAMTRLGSALQVPSANWIIYLYYLVNPASGSNTVTVTRNTSNGQTYGAAASYTGVDQTTPIDASTNNTGKAQEISTTLSSVTDDAWFFVTAAHLSGNISPTTNSTERGGTSFVCTRFDSDFSLTPAGSYNMRQESTGSREWLSIMLAMKPAAGGGSPVPPALLNFRL